VYISDLEPFGIECLSRVKPRRKQSYQSCRRLAVWLSIHLWAHPGDTGLFSAWVLCLLLAWYGFPSCSRWMNWYRRLQTNSSTQVIVTWVLKRYNHELQTSEMFSTAGRTVKSGLVASAVVSSWTWAATLLQSSSVAYRYGVSGPFWYASGATGQILLFASLAIELKRRAPNAHVSPCLYNHHLPPPPSWVGIYIRNLSSTLWKAVRISNFS
jgi:hypothetical protein